MKHNDMFHKQVGKKKNHGQLNIEDKRAKQDMDKIKLAKHTGNKQCEDTQQYKLINRDMG